MMLLFEHGIAVEAVMRYFATEAGEDVDYWGAVGLKDKRFAAGVNRDVILQGCKNFNMELDDVINKCILGMRTNAAENGL